MDNQGPKEKNTILSSRQDNKIDALQNEVSRLKSELALSTKKQAVLNGIAEEGLFFHKQKKITEVNEAFCKITDYAEGALIGLPLKNLFDKDSLQTLVDQIETNSSMPVEMCLKTGKGECIFVHAKAKSFNVGNKTKQLVLIQNITEIKKTRKSLEESEEKHRLISSLLSDYVYTCTIKPGAPPAIGWISGAIESICGFSTEEIDQKEMGWFSIIHPEDVQKVAESVNYNYKQDSFHNNEYRIIDRDGKIRWLLDRSMRLRFNKETNEFTILGATKDITYKKEIEENLRLKNLEFEQLNKELQQAIQQLTESQRKYKSVVKNSVLGIGISHKEHILFANEALLKIYGVKNLDEFVARKLTDYMPFESQVLVKERLKKYARNEPIEKVFRHQIIKADGNLATVEVTSSDLLYEGKNCRQVFMKDISHELETENALKQAANIFKNIQIGILIYRLDDLNEDWSLRLMAVNPASLNLIGFSGEEMVGKKIDAIFPNLRKQRIPEQYAEVVRTQIPIEFDDIYYEDERVSSAFFSVKVFPLPDQCVGVSFENISARRKAESELRTRNHELNNFVYKVSHDLRAPLSSIKGLIHLSKLEKAEISILPRIEERINHLDGFIRDILSHSRNLNSAVIIEKLNLKEIIKNCFDELEYLPNSNRVAKQIKVTGQDFYSDYIRVTEICRNLVSNAIKYQDVQKLSNYVHVDCKITPNSLKIIFEDNGIGIEQAYISEIFNMFYRATEESEGSGIGLYIVKQAVEKLEGDVSVSSIRHKGTKFFINLPNLISKKQG